MPTKNDLFITLSAAIEDVSPDQILTFKQYPAGYTVILTDFRKFTGVQPVEAAPADTTENDVDPSLFFLDDEYANYPEGLPEIFRGAYDYPASATVLMLRDLANNLGISFTTKTRKAQLVEEIDLWKAYNFPTNKEEE